MQGAEKVSGGNRSFRVHKLHSEMERCSVGPSDLSSVSIERHVLHVQFERFQPIGHLKSFQLPDASPS